MLLARQVNVPQLQDVLPRLRRDFARPQPAYGDLVLLPIGGDGHHDEDGHLTVPQALDLIESASARERGCSATAAPLVTPVAHRAHQRSSARPPSLRCRAAARACSRTLPAGRAGRGPGDMLLGICDTGLLGQPPPDRVPGWRASPGRLTRWARPGPAAG